MWVTTTPIKSCAYVNYYQKILVPESVYKATNLLPSISQFWQIGTAHVLVTLLYVVFDAG